MDEAHIMLREEKKAIHGKLHTVQLKNWPARESVCGAYLVNLHENTEDVSTAVGQAIG